MPSSTAAVVSSAGSRTDSPQMILLRILLLISLLIGGVWLSWHVPWEATLRLNVGAAAGQAHSIPLKETPIFAPPTRPSIDSFTKIANPYLDRSMYVIEVAPKRHEIFTRAAQWVVGSFFAFGLLGFFIQKKPVTSDVAYSLSLSLGFIVGTMASALLARVLENGDRLPWLSHCWTAGVAGAFVITFLRRRDLE